MATVSLPHAEIIETDGRPPIEGENIVEFRLLFQGMQPRLESLTDLLETSSKKGVT
jgi:hypothetical protein